MLPLGALTDAEMLHISNGGGDETVQAMLAVVCKHGLSMCRVGYECCLLEAGTPVASVASRATVVAVASGSAFASVMAVHTVASVAARTAWSAFTLYIAFGLGLEGAQRQAVFAGLVIDFDELDFEFVALFDS